MQQQMVQSHMMMSPQARSQEMLASTPHRQPQALGADALYQQYGPPGRRSALYQRDMDVRSMANFTSLKTGPQSPVIYFFPNRMGLILVNAKCILL